MAARAKVSGADGLILWALPGLVCASAWALGASGWDSLSAFLATWPIGLALFALAAWRARAWPEIVGFTLGVGVTLLVIAFDNICHDDYASASSYGPSPGGFLEYTCPAGASCFECVSPAPVAFAGIALIFASIGSYVLLFNRYR